MTFTGMPTRILPMSTSFTPALTIIFETSATVKRTVPALNDETPVVIVSPISTFFVSTTPSIGATTFDPWNLLRGLRDGDAAASRRCCTSPASSRTPASRPETRPRCRDSACWRGGRDSKRL